MPGAVSEALRKHCAAHLSAYKVPQSVHQIAEIPRTGSGKIIRFKLREMLVPKCLPTPLRTRWPRRWGLRSNRTAGHAPEQPLRLIAAARSRTGDRK